MEDEDPDFLPCGLGIIIHTDPLEAQRILRYIHQETKAHIIYKTIAPKGEKLWIKREVHPEDEARRGRAP